MPFPAKFYVASFELPLPDNRTVMEYFYLQTDTTHSPRLQTTQNPERYGGTVFLRPTELVEVLKLARTDVRFSKYSVIVKQIVLSSGKSLMKEEIDSLVRTQLLAQLDEYELEVLYVAKSKAGQK